MIFVLKIPKGCNDYRKKNVEKQKNPEGMTDLE